MTTKAFMPKTDTHTTLDAALAEVYVWDGDISEDEALKNCWK